ncbi:MAG: NUDIX domain-containing protein [Candidatus Moranbacteria bacterium]|nr:NUDIX domain-containing protein [Candidatus Moranbacteria bacterium]
MKIFNLSFEKSVGAVVFRESENGEKEFLLLHYPGGYWDFPKGHMEKGETEEQTLEREVAEESGINDLIIIPGFRDSMRYHYVAKGAEKEERILEGRGLSIFKKVIYYLAETKRTDIVISEEHIGSGWFSYEDALAKIVYENGKIIMRKAGEFLEKLS